jgi:hypothetical protein
MLKEFEKWEVKFIRPIRPLAKRSRARYIIIATYYLTKWVEEDAVIYSNVETVA